MLRKNVILSVAGRRRVANNIFTLYNVSNVVYVRRRLRARRALGFRLGQSDCNNILMAIGVSFIFLFIFTTLENSLESLRFSACVRISTPSAMAVPVRDV